MWSGPRVGWQAKRSVRRREEKVQSKWGKSLSCFYSNSHTLMTTFHHNPLRSSPVCVFLCVCLNISKIFKGSSYSVGVQRFGLFLLCTVSDSVLALL